MFVLAHERLRLSETPRELCLAHPRYPVQNLQAYSRGRDAYVA
jgi:hypothetical protein